MRLHAHLGGNSNVGKSEPVSKGSHFFSSGKMTYEEAFQNLLKSVFGEFQCRKGAL